MKMAYLKTFHIKCYFHFVWSKIQYTYITSKKERHLVHKNLYSFNMKKSLTLYEKFIHKSFKKEYMKQIRKESVHTQQNQFFI